jgi:hypothetical protein
MANKKWLVISYCCIFLSIYFLFIGYSAISSYVITNYKINVPQTISMNSTASAISSVSSWSGTLLSVGILTIILFIILYFLGHRAMGCAI